MALFITVIGPRRTIDLEIVADRPIRDLLPMLIEIQHAPQETHLQDAPDNWRLELLDRTPLPASLSLTECSILDGAVLRLHRIDPGEDERAKKLLPDIIPSKETGGIGVKWRREEAWPNE